MISITPDYCCNDLAICSCCGRFRDSLPAGRTEKVPRGGSATVTVVMPSGVDGVRADLESVLGVELPRKERNPHDEEATLSHRGLGSVAFGNLTSHARGI